MKLGVLTVPLYGMNLKDTMKYLSGLGVQSLELGCGGSPGKTHLDPDVYLNDDAKIEELRGWLEDYHMDISALSAHANPVHPQKDVAEVQKNRISRMPFCGGKAGGRNDCDLFRLPRAATLTPTIPTGLPVPGRRIFRRVLDYQWNQVLIPYWRRDGVAFAAEHGVTQIALEMHPGFCVYHTESLLRLRRAVARADRRQFGSSHLIWQGMDPIAVIRALKGAIYHFHAKDTQIDPYNTARIGVLDTKHYSDIENRAWVFRTVGYGTGEQRMEGNGHRFEDRGIRWRYEH